MHSVADTKCVNHVVGKFVIILQNVDSNFITLIQTRNTSDSGW